MITILVGYSLILISINVYLTSLEKEENNYYAVEVNRLYHGILENGYQNVSLEGYSYITKLEYMDEKVSVKEKEVFYNNTNDNYCIRTIQDKSGDVGYIKFIYKVSQQKYLKRVILLINLILGMVALLLIGVYIYIRVQIMKPFHEISSIPFELSKGHLTKNLKQSKNRFFGKFLWGLDLLREHLEERKARELKLEKEKKTLILSISHDIKTPLSAIKLYAKALYKNLYTEKEKQIEIAGYIEEKAIEIEGFVTDIIKASKEDFLNIEVTEGEFYLEDLIKRLQSYYQDKFDLIKTEFVIESFENNLIYGDMERTMEVFENIIENGIKYGDGRVVVISFSKEEDCVLITVSNTGCSLPEKEVVHIFESFWRGSNVNDKKGSGLGLYICRQILHKMQGEIFADIHEDKMNVTVVLKIA